jgi:hypothetical protein
MDGLPWTQSSRPCPRCLRPVSQGAPDPSAIVHRAAGFDYAEIGGRFGWSHTKVNRALYEGWIALREEVTR